MIVLDTHVVVFNAVAPDRLSPSAREIVDAAAQRRELACADITLWEIAMLVARGRLNNVVDARQFIEDVIMSRHVALLPVTPEIAVLAQSDDFDHGDPADRLIAATAQFHGATLVTSDAKLRKLKQIATVW